MLAERDIFNSIVLQTEIHSTTSVNKSQYYVPFVLNPSETNRETKPSQTFVINAFFHPNNVIPELNIHDINYAFLSYFRRFW